MLTARAEIARERRRMMQVRKALAAGLDRASAWNGREPGDFYLACADYLGFSMGRLHQQDQLIHDLLAERIPVSEADAHRRLAELNQRQQRSRELLGDFCRSAQALRGEGRGGVRAFEEEARAFTANFNSLLQPRKNPFSGHTDQLFADADWVRIAGVTPASLAQEDQLFAMVRDTAPSGVDPGQLTADHLPG